MQQTSDLSAISDTLSIRSGLARLGAVLLRTCTFFANERHKEDPAMLTRLFFSLLLRPGFDPFHVASVPQSSSFRPMPFRSQLSGFVAEVLVLLKVLLRVLPGDTEVIGFGKTFKVEKPIVCAIGIPVMDMTSVGNRPESALPYIAMQSTSRPATLAISFSGLKIAFTRPIAINSAIEILRERVKDDWINVSGVRDSADFHPVAVKNK